MARTITILKGEISTSNDFLEVDTLKFLAENPRVYTVTHGQMDFDQHPPEKQQDFIYEKLLQEPSVKNLIPDIKRHGGLSDPILVRMDTMEVIEGNSRLAVYRKLNKENPNKDWGYIPCDTVKELTPEQQAVYLHQIHVKGKTTWSAYEKTNFAHVKYEKGLNIGDIATLFGESEQTIRTRIKVIEMMKENDDTERSHFSYYDVVCRKKVILGAIENGKLPNLLSDIKKLGTEEENNNFIATELRKKLPVVLKKPRVLKKYNKREIGLDEAYQRAETSKVEESVKKATDLLSDVSKEKVKSLEIKQLKALKQHVRKLARESNRLQGIIQKISSDEKNTIS